jgi:hypothetical protein
MQQAMTPPRTPASDALRPIAGRALPRWIDVAEMRRIFADADKRVRRDDTPDCAEIEETLG